MGRTPQEETRIKDRRKQVEDLYLKGWTQADIARELGVSQGTISSDLKVLRQAWSESRIRDVDEVRDAERKKCDELYRKAWDGWQRSQEPVETTRLIQQDGEQIVVKTIRQQPGDPRFLQIIQRVIEARGKLLGMDEAASSVLEPTIVDKATRECVDVYIPMFSGQGPQRPTIDDEYIERLVIESAKRKAAAAAGPGMSKEKPLEETRSAGESSQEETAPDT